MSWEANGPFAPPPPPKRTAAERRILEAAEEAFIGSPRDSVKIADIARAAEVSVGLVYLQFGSKYGLYAAVREQIHIEFHEFTLSTNASDDELTWDHLSDYCRRWERAYQGDFQRARLLGGVDYNIPDEHMAAVNDRIRLRVSMAVAELGRRIGLLAAKGEVRSCDPYETAAWVYTSIWGSALLVLQAPGEAATAEVMSSLFARQRMMVAQALLPISALNADGTAPPEYWLRSVPRDGPIRAASAADRHPGDHTDEATEPDS